MFNKLKEKLSGMWNAVKAFFVKVWNDKLLLIPVVVIIVCIMFMILFNLG